MTSTAAPTWGFLTNHALMLVFVVRNSDSTVREISEGVGITERATLAILRQLEEEGIIQRHKDGRRNTYSMNFENMAAYRRAGTVSLTPRVFVDGLIQVLLDFSHEEAFGGNGTAPPVVDSAAMEPRIGTWGFFTNHALLLLSIAMDNESTVRELALNVGITERAVVAIANQLEDENIILRQKQGRRNSYVINFEALRRFPRWSPGEWEMPSQLVEMAVAGLRGLSGAPERPAAQLRTELGMAAR